MSREPVEQQDSKGKSQGDCVPLYNRKGEKALKMQDETGIIPLKINLLVRAELLFWKQDIKHIIWYN